MEKVLVSAVLLALWAVPAVAQSASFGLRGGVNIADLSLTPAPPINTDNRIGLVAGVFATVPAGTVVAFQPEALFSMQGTTFSEQGMTARIEMDYFQVPLLARVGVVARSPVALLVGPSLGIRTRARFVAPGAPQEASEAFADEVKRFDLGFVTGVAVDVGRAVIDGRYTWGLTNIAKDSGNESAKHRVLSLTAGVRF